MSSATTFEPWRSAKLFALAVEPTPALRFAPTDPRNHPPARAGRNNKQAALIPPERGLFILGHLLQAVSRKDSVQSNRLVYGLAFMCAGSVVRSSALCPWLGPLPDANQAASLAPVTERICAKIATRVGGAPAEAELDMEIKGRLVAQSD